MDSAHTDRSLEGSIGELATSLERERAEVRRTSHIVMYAAAGIVLIVLAFITTTVQHFRGEWTGEKVARGLQRQVELIAPMLASELADMAGELAPVYAEEMGQQFERRQASISLAVGHELQLLIDQTMVDAKRHMTDTEARVRALTMEVVERNFPELESPEEKARLVQTISDVANAAVARQAIAFESRYTKDMAELRDTIAGLDVQDTGEPTAELRRRFLSLWLRIIDEELMKP